MANQRRSRRRATSRIRSFFTTFVAFGIASTLIGGVFALRAYEGLCADPCIDLSPLEDFRPDEGSTLYDRHGNELGMLYRKNRRVVSLESVPPHVLNAFIAVEDRRFREHRGIDYRRVGGAVIANIKARGVSEGFSTITMQLARNAFPDALPYTERTLRRKLTEVRVARDIEERFSKDEILGFYLNTIYLGSGAYGVEAAARTYFGKPASQLTLSEAALLAGLPKAPSRYSPYRNPEVAQERRNLVLRLMEDAGLISPTARVEAAAEEIELAHGDTQEALESSSSKAPYFVEEIRRRLEERFGGSLYSSGLKVYTTLDPALQSILEEELEAQIRKIEGNGYGRFDGPVRDTAADPITGPTRYLQGSGVFIDPWTGDVLAQVGGRSFNDSEFDRVTQALRQPGSAFKPIVYSAAILAGISPQDSVSDAPIRIGVGQEVWEPKNFSEDTTQVTPMVTVADGLRRSRNRVAVRLALLAGLDSVASVAEQMGVSTRIPPYPSIALGSVDMTMIELVQAYSTLARADGHHVLPRWVTRVEDRTGKILYLASPDSNKAIDPAAATLVRDMLEDAVNSGTGAAVRRAGFHRLAAGKTGTSNESTDTWFVGFTPEKVGAIWIGFDTPRRILPGTVATGGTLAAPVWGEVMSRADTLPAAEPTATDTVAIDDWNVTPAVEERVATRRLIDGCPELNEITEASADTTAVAVDSTDEPASEEHELTPMEFLAHIVDCLRGTVRPERTDHYVCVPTLKLNVLQADSSDTLLVDTLSEGPQYADSLIP